MDELIPMRPNGQGGKAGGEGSGAVPAVAAAPQRPERPERLDRQPSSRPGSAGKHHLDSHIHTVDRAAASPALPPGPAPAGHHQGGHGHGHGHAGGGHADRDHLLKAAKPTELLEQVNKDQIIDVQAEVAVVADPAIHRDEDNRDKVRTNAPSRH